MGAITRKFALPEPLGVVTVTGPLPAPGGTVTEMDVSLAEDGVTGIELPEPEKVTEVSGVKFVPAIDTALPATPTSGNSEAMTGVRIETVGPA